jgi:CheY-like chemotaxis protein
VDDNRDAAITLGTLMRLTGHETQLAHDGQEACERAESYRPHVILLDIGLPKMNGYDVCRTIRRQPWADGVLIVALTGWGQDDDRRRSQEAGFDSHLVKPVDHDALVSLLTRLERTASPV